MCNRGRIALRTVAGNWVSVDEAIAQTWTCEGCGSVWPTELCQCRQCGGARVDTPYRDYVRAYGLGGAVRDPGPKYQDPEDVQIDGLEARLSGWLERFRDSAQVLDESSPMEYCPESEDVPMTDRLDTEAELGAVGRTNATPSSEATRAKM